MDPKAKRILLRTYWRNGWRPDSERVVSPEDAAYARAHGVMFDPVEWTHDDCVTAIQAYREPGMVARVGAGLLASMSTRRLDWRSAVASWVMIRELPPHTYRPEQIGTFHAFDGTQRVHLTCAVCRHNPTGELIPVRSGPVDRNVLNFERLKWGGVRHQNLDYIRFDLDTFSAQPPTSPTAQDRDLFADLLAVVDGIEPTATAGALATALRGVVPGAAAELRTLVEILATAGVLRPRGTDRAVHSRSDWNAAAGQWRGSDRYDRDRVAELLDI